MPYSALSAQLPEQFPWPPCHGQPVDPVAGEDEEGLREVNKYSTFPVLRLGLPGLGTKLTLNKYF